VIAILTKYEALVDRVKDEYKGKQVAKLDILNYAKKNVFNPFKSVTHGSIAIVQTHCESFVSIITMITTITIILLKIKGKVVNC